MQSSNKLAGDPEVLALSVTNLKAFEGPCETLDQFLCRW